MLNKRKSKQTTKEDRKGTEERKEIQWNYKMFIVLTTQPRLYTISLHVMSNASNRWFSYAYLPPRDIYITSDTQQVIMPLCNQQLHELPQLSLN